MNSINWDQVVVDHMAHTKAPLPYRVIGKVVSTVSLFSNQLAGSYLNQLWFKPIGPKISDKDKAWLNQAQRHDLKHKGLNVPVYAWGETPTPSSTQQKLPRGSLPNLLEIKVTLVISGLLSVLPF